MRPAISIIVIAHHNHTTLSACLDSIEQASLECDQLIIVGDDITPEVLAILKSRTKWLIVRTEM